MRVCNFNIDMLKYIALSTHTSGSTSTFLPAAISNENIFIRADIAYAFRNRRKLLRNGHFKEFASNWIVYIIKTHII